MASVQEDVTAQAWDLFLKFFGTGAEFVCQISHEGNVLIHNGSDIVSNFMLGLINKQKEKGEPTDAAALMLKRQKKGETIQTMQIAEEDVRDVSNRFTQNNILFTTVDNPYDDSKVVLYMSGDSEKVEDLISVLRADKGMISEISTDLFLNYYAKEGIGTISGLDKADLEVFRDFARDNYLVFTATPVEETGKYYIFYNPKDKAVVRKTMDSTVWAFSGDAGAHLRDQVSALIKNRERILAAFMGPEKEFYIANAKNPENYIQVTANELIYYKNSKEVAKVERDSKDFMDKAMQYIDGMDTPVLVKREAFEIVDFYGQPDKAAIAKNVEEKAKNLPDVDKVREEQEAHNERIQRLQSKMALDDENTAGFWIYAEDIDFEEGGVYEIREDIDEQMKTDIMDARKRAAKYKFQEVNSVDNRSLDYYIAEAEKLRAEPIQEHQQLEREK